jgi:VWFA-related protein
MLHRAPLFVSLLLLSALSLPAAQSQRETTTIEVVQVPVYVTDVQGSVAGLAREDFVLTVNGVRQPIDYFDVIDFGKVSRAQTRDPRQRRLYVLVFDMLYSNPNAVQRAQKAARAYVDAAGDSDYFAIASYTSRKGLQLVVPFTRDHETLRYAVSRLQEVNMLDPLRLALAEGLTAERMSGNDRQDGERSADRIDDISAIRELLVDPQRRLIGDQLDDLGNLATRLAPIEGQKHVVLLSGGFNNSILHGVNFAQNMRRGDIQLMGQTRTVSPLSPAAVTVSEPSLIGRERIMSRRFAAAGVFLDAIDINGVPGAWSNSTNEGLFTLAHDTGGSVVYNRNDLHEALDHLSDLQRVAYVLGFKSHDTGKEQNAIHVSLRNHTGVDVTYRPSYSATLPTPSANDALRIADILENDLPQTGITVRSSVVAEAGNARIDVEVPSRELLAVGGGTTVEGEALIYVYRGDAVVAFRQKGLTVDAARADAALAGAPIHITDDVPLPPGTYAVKVVVRVKGAEALGFARSDVQVGENGK